MDEHSTDEQTVRKGESRATIGFHQLRPKKLHELVADALEQAILTGHYTGGDTLPSERELIAEFGVSRTVVRDAIRTLATKGLIEVQHGIGAIVTTNARHALMDSLRLTLRRGEFNLQEMLEVRQIIDNNIAGLAAQRASSEDIERIDEILKRWSEAASVLPWEETVKIHHEFHLELIRATHNRALLAFIHPIAELLLISAQPQGPGPEAVEEYRRHAEIAEHIRAHDAEGAQASMRRHFFL